MDASVMEHASFSAQLKTVAEAMKCKMPDDLDKLSAARVASDAADKDAYLFLDSVNKLICLYLLEFPMIKVCSFQKTWHEVMSQVCTEFAIIFHVYCDESNMNVNLAHHQCILRVFACRCVAIPTLLTTFRAWAGKVQRCAAHIGRSCWKSIQPCQS
jgi:hypothetical protein